MTTTVAPPAHTTSHRVALARSRHAPEVARKITARWLADCHAPLGTAFDAMLIVSELVTNTLRHTSGPCTLMLTARGSELDIAVADTSAEAPRARTLTCADERGGFGLSLLDELGARVTVAPSPQGKTVHAALDLGREPLDLGG
ncbi:ATP-binding protein [Streptomyces actuosus]|uniref:ATP-binding protein n=1 Tax=Streptomyces actuosus TaxID=1885 RepID=A0ABS2VHK1_STRAS|nr:ATP-binding protein [Streptomyces actuosus]MBN0042578.1 ATP-binding protein [Streptomyces actuosus]